jgi:GT2 family glycosyltransferase
MNLHNEKQDPPCVHIIILTWNHWPVTAVCLQSLQQLTYPNHKIIVVDNASTDETVPSIRRDYPDITLLQNEQNLGFAAGCNVGLRHALAHNADYVLLLNNDATVTADLLDVLISQAAQLPDAGILTPRLAYQEEGGQTWFAGSRRHWLTLESVDFGPLGPRRHTLLEQRHAVDYIFGTAMFIPTPVLRKVGLFDEIFFLYYEDMDLCLRTQAAGYQLYYLPDATVYHGISASTTAYSAKRHYHKARGSVLFFRKHASWLRLLFITPYRTASMLRTLLRLAHQREWAVARAYLRGLKDGLIMKIVQ